MNKIDYIRTINTAVVKDDPKAVINILNELFSSQKYKELLDITFMAISSFQLYGFLAYLNNDEQSKFFDFDYIRTAAHVGQSLKFYNNEQKSLLYELSQYNKVFLSAPTSFGKTSIVIEYILDNHTELNNIIFIVPTNSLLEELYQKFIVLNKNLKMNYNISTQINELFSSRNILFLTPERFLLIIEHLELTKIDLIVMDEAYKIVNSKNQTISDFINDRAIRFRKVSEILGCCSNKVFFLSPFTYKQTNSMKTFLDKYDIKKLNRTLEYVDREIININSKVDFVEYFRDDSINYNKQMTIPEKTSVLLEQLKEEKNIVYVSNYNKGYDLIENINLSVIDDKNQLYSRYKAFVNHLSNNYCIEGIPKWKIVEALEKGCGLYISPIPRFIKKEIIKMYDNNLLKNLVVTTSFTEGVNTNAKNLIFTSLVNGPNTNKLADIDVLNVAGRAGRFSKSPIGKIFCISNEVFDSVKRLQDASLIMLENYNYLKQSNRIDYEIDMMEDEFLSERDKEEKNKLFQEMKELNLSYNDLKTCLNVSNKWKIILYKSFLELDNKKISKINEYISNLLNEDSQNRTMAIEFVLKYINYYLSKAGVNPYPTENYDIHAFDNSNNCIWSRLYKIYCQGSSKQVIESNIKYILTEFNKLVPNPTNKTKTKVKRKFEDNKKTWILRYFYENLEVNYNAFYSETFKFISNIIQYKIPFYLGYFVSIFNLYNKKNTTQDFIEFDVKKITLSFEEGNSSEEYSELIDFGISNDLILKLIKNSIKKKNLIENDFNNSLFDEYENIVLNEFIDFYKK